MNSAEELTHVLAGKGRGAPFRAKAFVFQGVARGGEAL
jgi:hypothetical protein